MLRLMLKAVALFALAAPALGLAGCSDSLSGNDLSYAKVEKSYEGAMTPQTSKAVINEMRQEQERVQKEAGIEPETTASTKPAKAKKQAEAPAEAAQN